MSWISSLNDTRFYREGGGQKPLFREEELDLLECALTERYAFERLGNRSHMCKCLAEEVHEARRRLRLEGQKKPV